MFNFVGNKSTFYAKSMTNNADVEETAKTQMKYSHGNANYAGYEREYNNRKGNVDDPNIAKTWQGRKFWAIPNIAICILKALGHMLAAVALTKSNTAAFDYVKENMFSAARDVEELYGNFILLFNDKLGLYHIEKAQFQKYCYHEFGKAPKMRDPYFSWFNPWFNPRFNTGFNANFAGGNPNFTKFDRNFEDFLRNHRANVTPIEDKVPGYYLTLGLARDASENDIRHAYRKLVVANHPDRQKQNDGETSEEFILRKTQNEEKFKEISTAYEEILKLMQLKK